MRDLFAREAEGDGDCDGADVEHLDDVPDGAGCVEIWERIEESRDDD